MWPVFEQQLARYRELEGRLADPDVVGDRAQFTRLAKEHGSLARKVRPYEEYKKVLDDIAATEALRAGEGDHELRAAVEQELTELNARREALVARLEEFLLAGDE